VALAGPGTVDEQNVALPRNERPSGQISNERFIDWRAGEVEVVEVFGERQLCRRELIFDRARLLLGLRWRKSELSMSSPQVGDLLPVGPLY
jgi:hypothetical protein